jgi:protein-S-isoprenylcysteine O-methyltransferase Ste14
MLRSTFLVAYSLSSYLAFLVVFLYFIGFVGGLPLPTAVDSGPAAPAGEALLIDLALLALFGVQHSVMARASFKRAWTRVIPAVLERSTFVLASSLALAVIVWQWRPIAQPVVWDVTGAGAWLLHALFWAGWAVMLASSFMINHFELFGLSQVCTEVLNLREPTGGFRTPLLYRYVRHPLYVGLLIAFWAAPRMTAGHLLFAAGFTAYILIGIWFEERDLIVQFGTRYADYRRRVGMLLPRRGQVT